jgi:hypothetical protein
MIVLHIDYEQGLYATAKRYQRLAIGHGIDPVELEGRLCLVAMPRMYATSAGAEAEYLRVCEGVDLVIVDSLRAMALGADENDSQIREYVDMWTRVSELSGAAAALIHHASKPRKDNAGDARMLARGSSAIYDASGCVLNFVAQPDGSKLVRQVKMPAEAEGAELEPFELLMEDVAVDGRPNAGVRVMWRKPVPVDEGAKASEVFERDAGRLVRAIRDQPGLSLNQLIAKAHMNQTRAGVVVRALVDDGWVEIRPGPHGAKECWLTEKGKRA